MPENKKGDPNLLDRLFYDAMLNKINFAETLLYTLDSESQSNVLWQLGLLFQDNNHPTYHNNPEGTARLIP